MVGNVLFQRALECGNWVEARCTVRQSDLDTSGCKPYDFGTARLGLKTANLQVRSKSVEQLGLFQDVGQ